MGNIGEPRRTIEAPEPAREPETVPAEPVVEPEPVPA